MSAYGLGIAANGRGSQGQQYTFPGISAPAGSQILVSRNASMARTYLGPCAPKFVAIFSAPNMFKDFNGDDAVELFSNGVVIETYGEASYQPSTRPWWFFNNSWAYKDDSAQWLYGPKTNYIYERFGAGACRGTSSSHNPASWYVTVRNFLGTLEDCQSVCSGIADCTAIEYEIFSANIGGHCEVWLREPQAAASYTKYTCMKRIPVVHMYPFCQSFFNMSATCESYPCPVGGLRHNASKITALSRFTCCYEATCASFISPSSCPNHCLWSGKRCSEPIQTCTRFDSDCIAVMYELRGMSVHLPFFRVLESNASLARMLNTSHINETILHTTFRESAVRLSRDSNVPSMRINR